MGLNTELAPDYIPAQALAACDNMYYVGPDLLRSRGGFFVSYAGGGNPIQVMYYWRGELFYADNDANLFHSSVQIPGVQCDITDMIGFSTGLTERLIIAEEPCARASESFSVSRSKSASVSRSESRSPSRSRSASISKSGSKSRAASQTHSKTRTEPETEFSPVAECRTLHIWDGTDYEPLTGTAVPCVRRIMVAYGRLWGTRDPNYPNRVYYSAVGDPTNWAGAWGEGGWFDVEPDHNGEVVDMIYWRDSIFILKERGTYNLTGSQPVSFQLRLWELPVGTVLGTLANCESGILYTGQRGIYPLGRGHGGEAHNLVRSIRQAITTPLLTAKAAFAAEHGICVLVDGTTTAWVSNVDDRPDAWTKWTLPVAMHSVYQGPHLYFGGADGNIYRYSPDAVTDETATITCSFKTGDWDMDEPVNVKNVRLAHGAMNAADNATVEMSFYVDGAATPSHAVEMLAGADPVTVIKDINFECKRSLALGFEYRALTGPCYFRSASLDIDLKGARV